MTWRSNRPAQQRRVEDVRPVRGRDDDHAGVRVEAVHLDEDLVERLLALVVRAAEARAALAPDRVDLVDEDDARRVARLAWSNRSRTREAPTPTNISTNSSPRSRRRTPASPRDGAREERLAGARRADEQHAARDARVEGVELLELSELDDFLELGLGLVDARDVGEGHDLLVAVEEHPGGLAERQAWLFVPWAWRIMK